MGGVGGRMPAALTAAVVELHQLEYWEALDPGDWMLSGPYG